MLFVKIQDIRSNMLLWALMLVVCFPNFGFCNFFSMCSAGSGTAKGPLYNLWRR